jgi:hypothetical protein
VLSQAALPHGRGSDSDFLYTLLAAWGGVVAARTDSAGTPFDLRGKELEKL